VTNFTTAPLGYRQAAWRLILQLLPPRSEQYHAWRRKAVLKISAFRVEKDFWTFQKTIQNPLRHESNAPPPSTYSFMHINSHIHLFSHSYSESSVIKRLLQTIRYSWWLFNCSGPGRAAALATARSGRARPARIKKPLPIQIIPSLEFPLNFNLRHQIQQLHNICSFLQAVVWVAYIRVCLVDFKTWFLHPYVNRIGKERGGL